MIAPGNYYKHLEKDTVYLVLSLGLMKQPDGSWANCVVYQPAGGGEVFVRAEASFVARFYRVMGK